MVINKKQTFYIVLILAAISALISFELYSRYKKIDPEDMIINKHRMVIVEKEEKVNYLTIENHDLKSTIVNQEKFNKLKQYMKDNNLRIKPGIYEIQDADTFKRLIRWRLKFELDI